MGIKKLVYKFFSLINYYYFPVNLNRQHKINYQEPYLVNFTSDEVEFLKKSAASFNYKPDYSRGYLQKPLFVAELNQVTYLGNSGALVYQHKIVSESVFDQVRLSISPAYRSPAFMWHRYKKGLYSSIVHLPWGATSNYHWFFDCLPRLYLLTREVSEPINLILNKNLPSFQLETLLFITEAYPHLRLVYIGEKEKWTVEKFLLPGYVTDHNSGYLPPAIANFLRDNIWRGYAVATGNTPDRIYISRKKANKRKILNEPQLEPILRQHNFALVYAEDLTYQEQVNLFYGAKYIVAPHGAGLTNILFSQSCSILEIQAADVIKPHYFLAAKGLGHRYDYYIGSSSDATFNFSVEVAAFSRKLQEFLSIN